MKYIRNISFGKNSGNIVTTGKHLIRNVSFEGETYTRDYDSLDEITSSILTLEDAYPYGERFPQSLYRTIRGGMGNYSLGTGGVVINPTSSLSPTITATIINGNQIRFQITLTNPGTYTGTATVQVISTNFCIHGGEWKEETIAKELIFTYNFVLEEMKIAVFYPGQEGDSWEATKYSSLIQQGVGSHVDISSYYCGIDLPGFARALDQYRDISDDASFVIFVGNFFTNEMMRQAIQLGVPGIESVRYAVFFANNVLNMNDFDASGLFEAVCFTTGFKEGTYQMGHNVTTRAPQRSRCYFVGLSDTEYLIPIFESGYGSELERVTEPEISFYMQNSYDINGMGELADEIIGLGYGDDGDTMLLVPSSAVGHALGSELVERGYNMYDHGEYSYPYVPVYILGNAATEGVKGVGNNTGVSGYAWGELYSDFLEDMLNAAYSGGNLEDVVSDRGWSSDENGCYTVVFWDVGIIDM